MPFTMSFVYYFFVAQLAIMNFANYYALGFGINEDEGDVYTIQAFLEEDELLPPTDGTVRLTKEQVSKHLQLSKSKSLTITCVELQNATFTNDPPFEVLGIPECAEYVQPKLVLYLPKGDKINASTCDLDPLNLPNNVTTDCFDQLNKRTDVKKLVLLIHGYLNGFGTSWLHEMQGDIQKVDPNTAVVIVGWGRGLEDLFSYWRAASNARYISHALFLLMDIMHDMRYKSGAGKIYVHCAGHSLGGQACGLTGKQLIAKNPAYKFDRISGMDPAGPLFCEDVPYPFNYDFINATARLGPDDAHFVDVIHTDGDARYLDYIPQYGTMMKLGTVDFYPGTGDYYGCYQPGCLNVIDLVSCSHSRAHYLYAASLVEAACLASGKCTGDPHHIPKNCASINHTKPEVSMGYWANPAVTGLYTVEVIKTDPYCAQKSKPKKLGAIHEIP